MFPGWWNSRGGDLWQWSSFRRVPVFRLSSEKACPHFAISQVPTAQNHQFTKGAYFEWTSTIIFWGGKFYYPSVSWFPCVCLFAKHIFIHLSGFGPRFAFIGKLPDSGRWGGAESLLPLTAGSAGIYHQNPTLVGWLSVPQGWMRDGGKPSSNDIH